MNLSLEKLSSEKHKDTLPDQTVAKIQSILKSIGIECEEQWFDENEIGTYSLHLCIKGTSIGSNGKGMTREFASASAYAELIERIQNNKVVANSTFNNVLREKKSEFYLYPNEQLLDAKELALENNSFMEFFFKTRNEKEYGENQEKVALLKKYQKLDYNIHRKKDSFLCIPYYSMRDKKNVNIPYTIMNTFYGSNGMCAGNTCEEALVQGMSEIVERLVQTKLIMEQLCLPDVPESYIAKYPDIYNIYKIVKSNENYNVYIKDGSFGGKYPACLLVITEKNTGWYGIKIGAHPDYHIAMERLFTEATQGIHLDLFAHKSFFDFTNNNVSSQLNLQNGFKTGDAKYPYQLFMNKPSYEFVEPKDFTNASNQEMLEYMIHVLNMSKTDILIHDTSYLQFPSYHIIVPGISEMNVAKKNDFEADNTRYHMQKFLLNPETITEENIRYIISAIGFYQHSLQSNTMKDFTGRLRNENFYGKEIALDMLYFKTMCYMYLKDYRNAKKTMDLLCYVAKAGEKWSVPNEYYFAVQKYIDGMCIVGKHDAVIECIRKFYDNEICDKIADIFKDNTKVIVKQYPFNMKEDSFEFKEVVRLYEMYNKKQAQTIINDNQNLAKIVAHVNV